MSGSPAATKSFRLFGSGWLTRRNLLVPGWKGWFLIFGLLGLAGYGGVRGIYPLLAVNSPESSEYLVVEGWIPDYALKKALDLSLSSHCRYFILTGGFVKSELAPGPGDTYARAAMDRLRRMGGNLDHVQVVDSPKVIRDRTYSSAVAVREWFASEGVAPRSINVLTLGPHARRSRLLFEKAFGPHVAVGIISIPDREYEPRYWWRYSEGVKEILSEGAAYLYARFLFRVS